MRYTPKNNCIPLVKVSECSTSILGLTSYQRHEIINPWSFSNLDNRNEKRPFSSSSPLYPSVTGLNYLLITYVLFLSCHITLQFLSYCSDLSCVLYLVLPNSVKPVDHSTPFSFVGSSFNSEIKVSFDSICCSWHFQYLLNLYSALVAIYFVSPFLQKSVRKTCVKTLSD